MTGLCDITWDKGLNSPTGDTPKLVILSQAVRYDIFKCGTESRHCGKRKKSKWTKLTNAEGHINLLQSLFSCVISCSVSRDRRKSSEGSRTHPSSFQLPLAQRRPCFSSGYSNEHTRISFAFNILAVSVESCSNIR